MVTPARTHGHANQTTQTYATAVERQQKEHHEEALGNLRLGSHKVRTPQASETRTPVASGRGKTVALGSSVLVGISFDNM